jgi:hypothetical protein
MPEFHGSYDNAGHVITVDPTRMHELYVEAKSEAEGLVFNIEDIVLAIRDLPWVGDSEEVAADFNQRWATTMQAVFGSEDNPSEGALQRFLVGIALAARNYGLAEDAVTVAFNDFADGLSGSSSEGGPRHGDLTEPPITLTFPD